jgi:peptide/nickel transport system permease protein
MPATAEATLDPPAAVTAATPVRPGPRGRGGIGGLLRTPGGAMGVGLLGAAVTVALAGPLVVGDHPFASVAGALQAPVPAHPFGTDDLGRDLLTMVVHGLRTSLVIALGVAVLSAVIALTVGAVAGLHPGRTDDLLMRTTELVQVVPRFFLAVVVVALFGATVSILVVLLGLTSWTWTARVVRAETLALREREYVAAARSFGAGSGYVLRRHVGPNLLPAALVMLSVSASSAVLVEAGLGFVGLSDPDVVSLGTLASNAQRFLRAAWWLAVFPGAALAVVVLGINLVGDAVGDVHGRRFHGRSAPAVRRASRRRLGRTARSRGLSHGPDATTPR